MKKILICCFACFSIVLSYAQRIPPSRLGKLQLLSPRHPRCYPLFQDRKIGVGYAVNHNLFSLKLRDIRWWELGLPLMLTTDVDYRPRYQGNGYFNMDLARINVIPLGRNSLSLNAGYKRVLADHKSINTQFYVGSSFFKNAYGITLAYTGQHQRLSDAFTGYDHGILLQYYREFFEQLDIKISGIYWFDEFQYSIRVNENLFYSSFFIGLGYERIGDWKEFDVSLSYIY